MRWRLVEDYDDGDGWGREGEVGAVRSEEAQWKRAGGELCAGNRDIISSFQPRSRKGGRRSEAGSAGSDCHHP